MFELPISKLREDRMDSDALFEGLRSFGRQELSCPTRVFMFIDLNWCRYNCMILHVTIDITNDIYIYYYIIDFICIYIYIYVYL